MGVHQLCRDESRLSPVQIQILEKSCHLLSFASDLSQREITVYVKGKEKTRLVVVAEATPLIKRYNKTQDSRVGTTYTAQELPLVSHVWDTGKPLMGAVERRYGKKEPFLVYPFVDNAGAVIAVVAFVGRVEESHDTLLTDTAFMALQIPQDKSTGLYQSLSLQDGIILIDGEGTVLYANEMAKQIVSLLEKGTDIEGRYVYESGLTLPLVKEVLQSREGSMEEVEYGGVVLAQRCIPLLRSGKLERLIVIVTEKTVLKAKETELLVKNSVIKEIHHRVKNNLQTVGSILRMQLRRVQSQEAKEALQEALNRILSIAMVHDILAHQEAEDIDVHEVLKKLVTLTAPTLPSLQQDIRITYEGESVIISSKKATSLAVVSNELLTNAILHGMEGREKGTVIVSLQKDGETLRLTVADDGCGMKEWNGKDATPDHLGMKLIKILVTEELRGTVRYEENGESGTKVQIEIPLP